MLVRRSILPTLSGPFDRNLDRLLHDAIGGAAGCSAPGPAAARAVPINVWEDDEVYHVEAELPGFTDADVSLSVLGREFRIEAAVEEPTEEDTKDDDKRRALLSERRTGAVSRRLRFATEIDEGNVKARLENGVLHVTLPKVKAALPRKIEIKG